MEALQDKCAQLWIQREKLNIDINYFNDTIKHGEFRISFNMITFGRLLCCRVHNRSVALKFFKSFSTVIETPEGKDEGHDPLNFDTLGTWDHRMDLPLSLPESIKYGKPIPHISVDNAVCASIIGRRDTNEDRYRVKELLPDLLYFAVFDGHGGADCAEFCSRYMEQHILCAIKQEDKDLELTLQIAFEDLNNAFAKYYENNFRGMSEMSSGSTATVCLLRNSVELVVGHVGDSSALLCRNGEAKKLTTDHGAASKAEKERIIKSGGVVTSDSLGRNLVNGRLDMTRSIGDLELKPLGVIALPDTRSLEVKHGKDAFLILTTDGINFVMSDQEICDSVNNCPTPSEAANLITDQAMQFGSQDNATAIIVPFGAWGKFMNYGGIKYSFGRNLTHSARY